ncbi:MAG: LamG-like jellyroll fold domain-containing protein [Bacteroides sp.]|jgi:hypothetical protein|nr:LamG-like jellyroll fold domain-containing protein [Bacteroides sp.]
MKNSLFVFSVFIFLFTLLSAQEPTESLIGQYDFSGNARDLSGNENHGIVKRVWPDQDVFTGENRGSFRFVGKKNQITIPIDINPVVMPEMTFVAWIKTGHYPPKKQSIMSIFSQDDGGFDRALKVRYNSDDRNMELFAYDGNGETRSLTIDRADWTFVAVVYDQNKKTVTVYANEKKRTAPAEIIHGSDFFLIGACPRSKHFYKGSIDEVRLYDRALSENEINTLFRAKVPYEEPPQPEREYIYIVSSNSLPVREKMDENSKVIGSLSRNDTIVHAEAMVNPANNERLVSFEPEPGKTGFVPERYLNRIDITQSPMERFGEKYMNFRSWYFWVILLGILVLAGLFIKKFRVIDEFLIYQADRSKYPGTPWAAMGAMIIGAGMGALLVFWQNDTEAFFNTPLFWPKGHALHTWIVWSAFIILLLGVIITAVESFIKAGALWGLLRFLLILVVSAIASFASMIIAAYLIVIAIILLVVLGILGGSSSKRVFKDSSGNVYVEQ